MHGTSFVQLFQKEKNWKGIGNSLRHLLVLLLNHSIFLYFLISHRLFLFYLHFLFSHFPHIFSSQQHQYLHLYWNKDSRVYKAFSHNMHLYNSMWYYFQFIEEKEELRKVNESAKFRKSGNNQGRSQVCWFQSYCTFCISTDVPQDYSVLKTKKAVDC